MIRRIGAFAERNAREILRDVLSYIFCLGFPLVMLIIMTLVDRSIPPEAGMTIFRIDNLSGGIAVFGQMFVMLFTAISVARDRSGAFLMRMFASPMAAFDFILGYMLPMLFIALLQAALLLVFSVGVSLFTGTALPLGGVALSLLPLLPSSVFFISLGLLFGTLCSDKAAPGLCSIIISLGAFLGSIWFDAQSAGGVLLDISRCLPFLYCTASVRAALQLRLTWDAFGLPVLIVTGSALLTALLAAVAFRWRMRAELA